MIRRIETLILSGALLSCLACGSDFSVRDGEVCSLQCEPTEVAVECQLDQGPLIVACGLDPLAAVRACEDMSGAPGEEAPLCSSLGPEASWAPGQSWDPGAAVEFDPTTGEYLIDAATFALVIDDLSLMGSDATLVLMGADGHYELAREGALSEALGWQLGDEFLSVNGLGLSGYLELVEAHEGASTNKYANVTIKRGVTTTTIPYRVE